MSESAPGEGSRQLFRYVTVEEWQDYRQIMAMFADTFFAELSAAEVAAQLDADQPLEESVVAARLEQLRSWGNLTVSSATGTPTSLDDYYRRRSRYLITQAGQQAHHAIEDVLSRADEVGDVSTGRLRMLLDALRTLADVDPETADPARLVDLVEAVFDPHGAFTAEITQFFASINQWQRRYDLSPEELSFFAQVLVRYVGERLDEVERLLRPIAAALADLEPMVPRIVERARGGLAARVEQAGLAEAVAVHRAAGSRVDDWEHLSSWFVARSGRPPRLEQLRRDAVAAIRTLTLNLTRLSRVGLGASSRRGDLLRLAGLVANARSAEDAHGLMHAAFGLYQPAHLGIAGADTDDPVPANVTWADAPPAQVPLSLRERGDRTSRGQASPMPDRVAAQRALRERRERDRMASQRIDVELLAAGDLHGATVSASALARLQQLTSRTLSAMALRATEGQVVDGSLRCLVTRAPGTSTAVNTAEGTLTLHDLRVRVEPSADGGHG